MERAWVLGTPNWRRAAHPRTPLDCCINEKGTFLVFIHQGFGIYVTNAIVTLNCKSNHESHLSVSKLEPLLGLGLPDMCSPTEPSVPSHLWMLLLRASETGTVWGTLPTVLGLKTRVSQEWGEIPLSTDLNRHWLSTHYTPYSSLDTKVQRHVFCPLIEEQTGDPSTNTSILQYFKHCVTL